MSSKSLFNMALLKKDFKILFPLFCTNLILLLLSFPLRYMQYISKLRDKSASNFEISEIINSLNRVSEVSEYVVFPVLISITVAIILFANEKNKKTIEMISVAPFSRSQIYVNKIAIGLAVSIIPTILVYLISYGILVSDGLVLSLANLNYIKQIFILAVVIQLVIFSYYIMVSMLFGSVVSTLVCGTIFTFFPVAIPVLANGLREDIFSNDIIELFAKVTPFVRLVSSVDDMSYGISYMIVMSLLFIIAGYFLFELYKMEKNSEFLTFKWTESVFKVGTIISSALLGANILNVMLVSISEFEFINKFLGFVIGAGFGYFIPKTIISVNKQE